MNSKHMDTLEKEILAAVKEVSGDVCEDQLVYDTITSMTTGHSLSVRNEMLRRFGL
jgi:hypothetical protein